MPSDADEERRVAVASYKQAASRLVDAALAATSDDPAEQSVQEAEHSLAVCAFEAAHRALIEFLRAESLETTSWEDGIPSNRLIDADLSALRRAINDLTEPTNTPTPTSDPVRLTLRMEKGYALTHKEMDDNFRSLANAVMGLRRRESGPWWARLHDGGPDPSHGTLIADNPACWGSDSDA